MRFIYVDHVDLAFSSIYSLIDNINSSVYSWGFVSTIIYFPPHKLKTHITAIETRHVVLSCLFHMTLSYIYIYIFFFLVTI